MIFNYRYFGWVNTGFNCPTWINSLNYSVCAPEGQAVPCCWLNKQWQTKREGSLMAENSAEVRMRAAGPSLHFSTFLYLQHMNYRFVHASSQKVDAVFTSQWCLQTKVSREGDHLIMTIVCLNLWMRKLCWKKFEYKVSWPLLSLTLTYKYYVHAVLFFCCSVTYKQF